jgi:hypothetical protein
MGHTGSLAASHVLQAFGVAFDRPGVDHEIDQTGVLLEPNRLTIYHPDNRPNGEAVRFSWDFEYIDLE